MKHYVYIVEGEPHVGTVEDIAHAFEVAEYSSLDVQRVWEWSDAGWVRRDWHIAYSVSEDWRYCVVRVEGNPDEVGRYKIDLRA